MTATKPAHMDRTNRWLYYLFFGSLKRLPQTPWGDRWYALAHFIQRLGRLPRKSSGDYNDFLFYVKTSREIDKPLRGYVSDKENLKAYVTQELGQQYCVPTLGIIRSTQELEGFRFPDRCAIKPTHMSGQVILRHNGEALDMQKMRRWLTTSYYRSLRERNYRNLYPKILVEELLEAPSGITELCVHCLRGKPKVITLWRNHNGAYSKSVYLPEWTPLNFVMIGRNPFRLTEPEPQPANLHDILRIAACLARDFLNIRVDFFLVRSNIYIGELTNSPGAGGIIFEPAWGAARFSEVFFGRQGFKLADFPELQA
jgi:hypothetical protein